MVSSLKTIIVCGHGLAAQLVLAKLAASVGAEIRLIHLTIGEEASADAFYGSVTAPTAYDFLHSVGLDEPTLFLRSRTSFSWGTYYQNWPGENAWMQAHHLPLSVIENVPLQHFLTYREAALEPLLVSAQAAKAGRFAHPPEDPQVPLSRAEYGYQFVPSEWAQLLASQPAAQRIERKTSDRIECTLKDGAIEQVTLSSGETLKADLYIDGTGPDRKIISNFGAAFLATGDCCFTVSDAADGQTGPAHRTVRATEAGWDAMSALQGGRQILSVSGEDGAGEKITCGRLPEAWIGNCVAIGQAAHVIAPLTPAPMMLLQRDIERLVELLPVSAETSAERREYNRRFNEDAEHAELFQTTLLRGSGQTSGSYWQPVADQATSAKYERKIGQFESRGLLVKYDLEPFNDEDWMILHFGIGRRPARFDRQVSRLSDAAIDQQLGGLAQAIQQMVPRVPPHGLYINNMKRYFEKQNHA